MMTERDEADELPEAADAITSAISSLIREWVTVMTVKTVILYFLFLTP